MWARRDRAFSFLSPTYFEQDVVNPFLIHKIGRILGNFR